MKRRMWFAAALLASCGCSTMNNTEAGALGGSIFGGALGTAIGAATGHPLAGAAIGAGTGALAGGAIGASEDRAERRHAQAVANHINNPPLSVADIVRLSQNRQVSDQIIIQQINASGSVYNLSAADIEFLKQNGVSDAVVLHMQARHPGMVRVAPANAVYVEPMPPPPVSVGFGFGYGYGPRCRHW